MGRKKPTARDDDNAPAASQGGGKSKKKGLVIDDDEYSIGTEPSEEPPAQEEKPAATGKKKGKKGNSKASEAEHEDLEKAMDDDDDVPEVVFTGKKKGKSKKGGGNSVFTASSFGLLGDEEGGGDDEDKQSDIAGEVGNDDEDEPVVTFSGKKKSSKVSKKKGGSLFTASAFDIIDEDNEEEVIDDSVEASREENDDMEEPVIAFTGKKKSSKSSKKAGALFTGSSFGNTNGEQDKKEQEDEDEDVAPITFTGKKKKSSKSLKKAVNTFSAAVAEEDVDDDDFVLESTIADEDKVEDEDVSIITFSGKKKSSKRNKTATTKASDDFESVNESQVAVEPGQPSVIDNNKGNKSEEVIETSKNKKKKNKKSGRTAQEEEDLDKLLAELGEGPPVKPASPPTEDDKVQASSEVAVPATAAVEKEGEEETIESAAAKKKKKNKKSGRTAQEEEDLDKLLAELGEGPPVKPALPPAEKDKVQASSEVAAPAAAVVEKEGEEETMESAAVKKKKKKKEKEKEKKAAAAAAAASAPDNEKNEEVKPEISESKKNDSKSKAADKKVPKHVREMQEALARRKEAEERKKREEEERLRKEEEERRRQEELERQAEEARRRKKEREKEKLQKKKQEGKLLTGKQKEEARRLEAMRKQFLAGTGGVTLPTGDSGVPAKRPIYQTKKSKQAHHQQNGTAPVKAAEDVEAKENLETTPDAESLEPEKDEVVESVQDEDNVKPSEDVEEDEVEEDDEDEWDAKSWDDVNLNGKSAFADEEADSEPEPVVKKEIKNAVSTQNAAPLSVVKSTGTTKKAASTEQIESKMQVEKQPPKQVQKQPAKQTGLQPPNSAVPSQPSGENLRSPICCIMGHVDTGKTKLLDCIRGTNVQEGEAGGITQQIGATYFPAENIRERTKELKADAKLKVPGLLVIDTPGHESFTNLRSRGSGLCDIAILVVDIMHGLEPQTIESLNLLKMRNTEFIVALNKVDRLYGWKVCRNSPIVKAMKQQTKDVQNEFNMRVTQIITQFKEQGLNSELYYKNKEMGETFSIVPTSAISGEGIPDLLLLLVQWTQKTMAQKLTYSDEVQCTVLEVKVVEGHGTTIDVVLVNGVLHEGDQIVVCGMQGPIVTTIRALLTPHPMKELRVKGTYLHHKEIKAAMGIKITAQGLEHAIAGTALYVVKPEDDLEDIKEAAMEDMESVMNRIDKSGEGVCVQASTLGSLEALLEFLKTPEVNIPVSGISIGPVHKKDVMKASVMLEKKREFATILAFDVKVNQEAKDLAEELGVKIFMADIIYHLFDQFKAYIDNIKEEKKKESADEAVFPCVLKILPNCIFNKKDPIVLGVDILEGVLKVGTPICVPSRDYIDIGRIASIENNHKPVDYAKKGQKVAIKIAGSNPEEQQKMYGRHFEIDDELVSHISRRSIDILKANYRDELSMEEWRLVAKLKNVFKIQ
ncbi:eukaryotic translation initiation factor 5B [Prosopis cineraria]|uniref:eukaryotic translation initiation factor 5B n=1 Tax=Prosopis cineraria TaxID=364024 RepID=UPI00240FA061|nr:eukaryotic translation initiation factor 5B [Prosopis cineraria]XP_054787149.1 eukaryotic translation initiation factor 5B [Prosopis cineraria]